jgi:hypothetical protein
MFSLLLKEIRYQLWSIFYYAPKTKLSRFKSNMCVKWHF